MKQYRIREDYDILVKLEKRELSCFSRKRFEELQKQGAVLAGAIHGGNRAELGQVVLDTETISYHDLDYSRMFWKPAGYLQCEDETYLVVLKRSLRPLLWLLLMVSLVALLIGFFVNINRGPDLEPGLEKFKAANGLPDGYGENSFIIPAYNQIYMPAGGEEASVALWNPEKNRVYFKFVILLDTDGSTIFESKLVPPGMALRKIHFTRSFEKGSYPITIRVRTYDVEEYEQELNNGEIKTSLIALDDKK